MRTFDIRPELAQAWEGLGESVGLDTFPKAAMTVIGQIVDHDMQWIMTYARKGRPIVHHHLVTAEAGSGIERDQIRELYDSGYYRFDPFFRYWRGGAQPGVVSMHDVLADREAGDEYLTLFMPHTGVEDDVAVLLDLGDGSAIGLCVERRHAFTAEELDALKAAFPLLNGLAKSHCRVAAPVSASPQVGLPPLDFGEAVAAFLPDLLTPRERQIVSLALTGFDNASIADRLGIGIGTIKNHRKRIHAKIDVTSERELFSLFLGHLANSDPSQLLPDDGS